MVGSKAKTIGMERSSSGWLVAAANGKVAIKKAAEKGANRRRKDARITLGVILTGQAPSYLGAVTQKSKQPGFVDFYRFQTSRSSSIIKKTKFIELIIDSKNWITQYLYTCSFLLSPRFVLRHSFCTTRVYSLSYSELGTCK
jgi:hypothetical protein